MPKIKMIKTFENFSRICRDNRAWMAACLEQNNDSWILFQVASKLDDPDEEHLRQWLFKNGISEEDECVFLRIDW